MPMGAARAYRADAREPMAKNLAIPILWLRGNRARASALPYFDLIGDGPAIWHRSDRKSPCQEKDDVPFRS